MSTNTWYHAAIVYDASADTVSYYLDGSRLSTVHSDDIITEMVVGGGMVMMEWFKQNFKLLRHTSSFIQRHVLYSAYQFDNN